MQRAHAGAGAGAQYRRTDRSRALERSHVGHACARAARLDGAGGERGGRVRHAGRARRVLGRIAGHLLRHHRPRKQRTPRRVRAGGSAAASVAQLRDEQRQLGEHRCRLAQQAMQLQAVMRQAVVVRPRRRRLRHAAGELGCGNASCVRVDARPRVVGVLAQVPHALPAVRPGGVVARVAGGGGGGVGQLAQQIFTRRRDRRFGAGLCGHPAHGARQPPAVLPGLRPLAGDAAGAAASLHRPDKGPRIVGSPHHDAGRGGAASPRPRPLGHRLRLGRHCQRAAMPGARARGDEGRLGAAGGQRGGLPALGKSKMRGRV